MKKIWILGLILTFLVMGPVITSASPLSDQFDTILFYGIYNDFNGGEIKGDEMKSFEGSGIGMLIPLSSAGSVGLEYSSKDYDNLYYELQAVKLYQDKYLLRFNFSKYGRDGEIVHFGAYKNYPVNEMFKAFFGAGISMVCFSQDKNPDDWAYFSLFFEAQGQMKIAENLFLYSGAAYDYHLNGINLEAGLGVNF